MVELAGRSVEELDKIKKRVTRLYGAGRICKDDFTKLDTTLGELDTLLKTVKETEVNE